MLHEFYCGYLMPTCSFSNERSAKMTLRSIRSRKIYVFQAFVCTSSVCIDLVGHEKMYVCQIFICTCMKDSVCIYNQTLS